MKIVPMNESHVAQIAALEAMGDYKGTLAISNYETGEILCAVTTPTYDPDNIPDLEKDKDGKVIKKQLEIDFVCNMGSKRYYIQSAYSLPDAKKREQEIRPFRRIDDSFRKIIVTRDIVPAHYDEYGIFTVSIYDFLLNPDSLDM